MIEYEPFVSSQFGRDSADCKRKTTNINKHMQFNSIRQNCVYIGNTNVLAYSTFTYYYKISKGNMKK